ncbi:hypothetical protein [Desmospora profundinema]|uniref:DUF305 domain-containing protein n=1 Tax=Desmospora profundinema TaxID=1571184 RepID=A0ABU1IPX3_9BACL|nr:hypothetical protein [Desmospora profundinema]MDR6226849.1 hypothetical protein [Desmospora profundinema]
MPKTMVVLMGVITLALVFVAPAVFADGEVNPMMEHERMSNGSMDQMMNAMNTSEGKKVVKACNKWMEDQSQ